MKKFVSIVLSCVMIACSPSVSLKSSTKASKSSNDALTDAYNSVGMLYINGIDGKPATAATAFSVSKDRLVTAGHFCIGVIELTKVGLIEDEIYMQHYRGLKSITTQKGLKIEAVDEENDLCTLTKPSHGLPPLDLADDESVGVRDEIHILGSPLGIFLIETVGKVASKDAGTISDKLKDLLVLSCQAMSGNSGGPVLDRHGRVVGVLVQGIPSYTQVSFATKASKVAKLIKTLDGKQSLQRR